MVHEVELGGKCKHMIMKLHAGKWPGDTVGVKIPMRDLLQLWVQQTLLLWLAT